MSISALRIGVVGAGVMGSGHVEYVSSEVDNAQVVALAEPDRASRQALVDTWGDHIEQYDSLGQMADSVELDGIIVASPDRFHADAIRLSLERGIPMLCEKPMAERLEDAREVHQRHDAIEQERGAPLVYLGFMRRFDPGYRALKDLVDSGDLGRALYMVSSTRNVHSGPINSDQMLTNIAVHEIDLMRWLFSSEWTGLQLHTPPTSSHSPEGLVDPIVITGSLARGPFVVSDTFAFDRYGYDVRAEITFEDGVARLDVAGKVTVTSSHQQPMQPGATLVDNWIPRFRQAYIEELRAWTGTLRGTPAPDLAQLADGLATLQAIEQLTR